MFPSAHYSSGVAIFALMSISGLIPKDFLYLSLMITCSIIPDSDFIISSLHRELFTHTPIFWLCIIAIVIATEPNGWIVAPPLLFHLFLDTIDWGLMMFYPFSRKKYGFRLLGEEYEMDSDGLIPYLREYISHPRVLYIEIAIMILSLFLLVVGASLCF